MIELNSQIAIEECRFRKNSEDDAYMDRVLLGEITEYDTSNDNVEIMLSDGHFIRFRLWELLKILSVEIKEATDADED